MGWAFPGARCGGGIVKFLARRLDFLPGMLFLQISVVSAECRARGGQQAVGSPLERGEASKVGWERLGNTLETFWEIDSNYLVGRGVKKRMSFCRSWGKFIPASQVR